MFYYKPKGIAIMIKILTLLVLLVNASFAKMIGGVSVTVDNEPITLTEIREFQKQTKVSKQDALNALIQKKLEERAVIEHGIHVNPYDVDQETEAFAKKNGVDIAGLRAGLKEQGVTLEAFKKDLSSKLKREKLTRKVLAGRIKKPDDAALKTYYESHKKEFKLPGDIKVIEYTAKDGKALQMLQAMPMMNHPGVKMKEKTMEVTKINPQLGMLLLQTPETTFTQIINIGDGFATFFIKEKLKEVVVDFERAKQSIYAKVMKERERAIMIEFFEKKKAEAIIKVVRKP